MHVACKVAFKLDGLRGVKCIHMPAQKGQIKCVSQTENCQLKMISESRNYFEVRPTIALSQCKSDEQRWLWDKNLCFIIGIFLKQ